MKYSPCSLCTDSFSCFFKHASPEVKKEVMEEVAKEAWEEQRRLLEDNLP